ncbi:MAG: hypothetical protein ABJH63_05105 [Rhizobiaceae bacterium]
MQNGTSSLSLSVNPEFFRALAYVSLWILLLNAATLTMVFMPGVIYDNPILKTFGVNNICILLDDQPAAFFSPFIWSISSILFFLYFASSAVQQRQQLLKGALTKRGYRFRIVSLTAGAISVCIFSTVFAISPYENLYVHVLSFFFLIIALSILAVANTGYYIKTASLSPIALIYAEIYSFAVVILSILYIMKMLNALYFDGMIPYLEFINSVFLDRVWTILVGFLPFFHSLYLIRKTNRLKISFN